MTNRTTYITADWIEPLTDLADDICLYIPSGYEISINFTDGVCVTLINEDGNYINLPDQTDRPIAEQINDALLVANGFDMEGIV